MGVVMLEHCILEMVTIRDIMTSKDLTNISERCNSILAVRVNILKYHWVKFLVDANSSSKQELRGKTG